MIFTSASYLLFFPLVVLLYFSAPTRYRWGILLVASCIFYMAFIPAYILILVYLILVDYAVGIAIERSEGESRRNFLVLSLFANISVLGVFKYFDFFNDNLRWFFSLFGYQYPPAHYALILPIGLSFHTFQSLSYTFEVYYGRQKAERHLGHYALYVMFFPQLVAGPIERPAHLLPQLTHTRPFDERDAVSGLRLILWGFFQKLVIADRLAPYVDEAYAHPARMGGGALLIATFFFALQIYCDFSAYSDIARGSARVLRIQLMRNFDAPYFAGSLSEFWRRWHISLSSWFRDYVYIPLGGNRVPWYKHYRNILVVFFLSGLWHGANWTFIVWGLIHGVGIVLENIGRTILRSFSFLQHKGIRFLRPISTGLTFLTVCVSWSFFRARNVAEAVMILERIFHDGLRFQGGALTQLYLERTVAAGFFCSILFLLLVNAVQRRPAFQQTFDRLPAIGRWGFYYAAVLVVLVFGGLSSKQFIYFQF